MKKPLLTLLLIALAIAASAEFIQFNDGSTLRDVSTANPFPTTGSPDADAVFPVPYWSVGSPTFYQSALATDTAKRLTAIASFTTNTLVRIQSSTKLHEWTAGALTATTTMQAGPALAADQAEFHRIGTTTWDMSVVGDAATTVGTITLTIFTLY